MTKSFRCKEKMRISTAWGRYCWICTLILWSLLYQPHPKSQKPKRKKWTAAFNYIIDSWREFHDLKFWNHANLSNNSWPSQIVNILNLNKKHTKREDFLNWLRMLSVLRVQSALKKEQTVRSSVMESKLSKLFTATLLKKLSRSVKKSMSYLTSSLIVSIG